MTPDYAATSLLFRRAGFGGLHSEIVKYETMPWEEKVDMVLDLSRAPADGSLPNLAPDRDWYAKWVDMNHFWLDRARRPVDQAPIQEKMVLFWHGFLCSGMKKVGDHRMMFDQNRLFRRHALGRFDTLLWETSIDPAMLTYLDNRQNTVGNVNENFGRELLELFSLGVGNFTEEDVRSSARAWTGHGLGRDKRYRFDPAAHDNGSKRFLGASGNWNGQDIIRLIVERRRDVHARLVCRKLWSFFAYPVGPDDPEVADIVTVYRQKLDIGDTVRAIFLHPRFRSERSIQGLVRSPIEFAVAAMRHTRLACDQAHPEWYLTAMGQRPFDPPNVSGWRQNDYWISESAIWAKGTMASHLRWLTYDRGDLDHIADVVSYNPRVYKISTDEAVSAAMVNYNMRLSSPRTRRALLDYVDAERRSDHGWGQQAGLLMLPLLTPEFQLA